MTYWLNIDHSPSGAVDRTFTKCIYVCVYVHAQATDTKWTLGKFSDLAFRVFQCVDDRVR